MKVLTEPFTPRSLAELGYALVGLPLGVLGFLFSVASLTAGTLLVATLLGLPLTALGLHAARGIGGAHRAAARALLGTDVAAPTPAVPTGPGLLRWLGAGLRDPGGWQAHAYLLLSFPLAVLAFVVAAVLRVGGLLFVIVPLLQGPLAAQVDATNGFVPHAFVTHYGGLVFDSWPQLVVLVLQGVAMSLLAPWALRPVLALDQLLVRWLLGPSALTERVRDLERTRAAVVDDAAARLRGIERDLHDGAQAQLVAVAMKLSLASEKLTPSGSGIDVARVRELVDTALGTARSAIVGLRDLVAGIHPPILDEGLAPALTALAAHSAVPTTLTIDLPTRPSPAVEAIVYFCTSELLTNAAKHSDASTVTVELTAVDDRLRLLVADDGRGGASPRGSGLGGLAARAQAVDGSLNVDSPRGGPTTITVELPTHP